MEALVSVGVTVACLFAAYLSDAFGAEHKFHDLLFDTHGEEPETNSQRAISKLIMKFPRFRGHRNICVSGVRNVEETSPIPA